MSEEFNQNNKDINDGPAFIPQTPRPMTPPPVKPYGEPPRVNQVQYTPPQAQYVQPQGQYIPPQAQYVQPQGQYIPPQAQYVQPQGQYIPPQAQYVQPQGQYIPPQAQYVQPQGQYIPPQAQYVQPQGQYIPPQAQYVQPQYVQPAQYAQNYYTQKEEESSPTQENGIPIRPRKEEKSYIRRFYNWTGGLLLIQFGASLLITLMLLGAFEIVYELTTGNPPSELLSNVALYIGMVIAYLFTDVLITAIGAKITDFKMSKLFRFKTFSPGFFLLAALCAIGINCISLLTIQIINGSLELIAGFTLSGGTSDPVTPASLVVECVYGVLIAPFIEELLFRGLVLKNLTRFNTLMGIVMSAFLFGIFHGNFFQFGFAFPFGIALGYITVKTGSIWPAVFIHAISNGGITVMEIITYYNEDFGNMLLYIWLAFFIFAGAAALIILLAMKKITLPQRTEATRKRGLGLLMTSPAMLVFIISQIIMCILSIEKV